RATPSGSCFLPRQEGGACVTVIHPTSIYDLQSAREAVGMSRGCLPREIRLGRLRAAKRGGKILILGSWLLEWIRTGEVRRGRDTSSDGLEANPALKDGNGHLSSTNGQKTNTKRRSATRHRCQPQEPQQQHETTKALDERQGEQHRRGRQPSPSTPGAQRHFREYPRRTARPQPVGPMALQMETPKEPQG